MHKGKTNPAPKPKLYGANRFHILMDEYSQDVDKVVRFCYSEILRKQANGTSAHF